MKWFIVFLILSSQNGNIQGYIKLEGDKYSRDTFEECSLVLVSDPMFGLTRTDYKSHTIAVPYCVTEHDIGNLKPKEKNAS